MIYHCSPMSTGTTTELSMRPYSSNTVVDQLPYVPQGQTVLGLWDAPTDAE